LRGPLDSQASARTLFGERLAVQNRQSNPQIVLVGMALLHWRCRSDNKNEVFRERSMKFQRRRILSGMAALLAVPLARPVDPAAAADKIKIGFLLKTMQEERYQRSRVSGQGQGAWRRCDL
jgi:hypothetical protein